MATSDEDRDLIGVSMGGYQITRRLGVGGMGAVYLAENATLQRQAAVKVLLPAFTSHVQAVKRFFQEARVVSRLNHPSIVEVFDFNQLPDGTLYLLMEYVEGIRLRDYLAQNGRLTVPEALEILVPLASALHAAHQKMVVHRDVKPDNVMLKLDPETGRVLTVKLLDFGVAKLLRPQQEGSNEPPMTVAGAVLGTPRYMAPEQAKGAVQAIGPATDIYALGIIAYECLTGRVPFTSRNFYELAAMHSDYEVPPMDDLEYLGALRAPMEALVMRCLAKQPAARFGNARALEEALEALRSQLARRETAPPTTPVHAVRVDRAQPAAMPNETTLRNEQKSPHAAPVAHAVVASDPAEPPPTKRIQARPTALTPIQQRQGLSKGMRSVKDTLQRGLHERPVLTLFVTTLCLIGVLCPFALLIWILVR